jgi:flagellar hook assembly protein FlgD
MYLTVCGLCLLFLFFSNIYSEEIHTSFTTLSIHGKITTTNGPAHGLEGTPIRFINPEILLNAADTTDTNGEYTINTSITGIEPGPGVPKSFDLKYGPNPFNPHIRFFLTLDQHVNGTVEAYTITGQHIKTIYNGELKPGLNEITWDGTNNHNQHVAQSNYIIRIKAGDRTEDIKVTYIANPAHGPDLVTRSASQNESRIYKPTGGITATVTVTPPTDSLETYEDEVVLQTGVQNTHDFTLRYKNFAPYWQIQPEDLFTPEDNMASSSVLSQLAKDFNPDELTYSVKNLPQDFTSEITDGKLYIQAPTNFNGTVEGIVLTVTDGQYSTDSNPFTITWDPINDAPTIDMPDYNLDRNEEITAPLDVNDPDNTPNQLTVTAQYDPQQLEVTIDNTTKQATIKALGSGNPTITWKVTDPNGLNNEDNSTININYLAMLMLDNIRNLSTGQPVSNDLVTAINTFTQQQAA